MKQLARRASFFAMLLLLTSAGPASAQCAWVQWRYPGFGAWNVWTVYNSRSECIRSLDALLKEAPDDPMRQSETRVHWSNSGRTVTAQCLPDTIDPRGPKGK